MDKAEVAEIVKLVKALENEARTVDPDSVKTDAVHTNWKRLQVESVREVIN